MPNDPHSFPKKENRIETIIAKSNELPVLVFVKECFGSHNIKTKLKIILSV